MDCVIYLQYLAASAGLQLYWFTCFNSDAAGTAGGHGPVSPAELKADARAPVEGWSFGVPEAIANTPEADITRSRLGDRCGSQ